MIKELIHWIDPEIFAMVVSGICIIAVTIWDLKYNHCVDDE